MSVDAAAAIGGGGGLPLRFSIGGVIATGFAVLFRNFFRFLVIVLAVGIPIAALIGFGALLVPGNEGGFSIATMPVSGAGPIAFWILAALAFVSGYALVLAAITQGALLALRGAPVDIGACIGAGIGLWPKAFTAILLYLIVMIAGLAVLGWGVFTVMMERIAPDAMQLAAGIAAVAVSTALMVLVLVASWVFVPAIMAERAGPIACFRRSFALTKGRRWAVVGFVALSFVANFVVAFLVEMLHWTGAWRVAEFVDYGTSGILTAFLAVAAAVSYDRLRAEKEGAPTEELVQVFD